MILTNDAMIDQTYIRFSQPITLDLRIATGPRPRVVPVPESSPADEFEHVPELHEFSELPMHIQIDAIARTITAYLSPIPAGLEIYGPEDFTAAASDSMDDHAARVMQILEPDLAGTLQALIDGTELPPRPVRIPREIANWRAKAILGTMGLTEAVDRAIDELPEPQRTVVRAAWAGDAKLARRGPTVAALALALGLTPYQIDSLFIEAESLAI